MGRIAEAAVDMLGRDGPGPGALRAAIGPCIGVCCYEVGDDLAGRFADAFGVDVVQRQGPRPHLDLRLAVRRTLEQAGVEAAHIEDVAGCTACEPARFFSHRRDRGGTGRHLAFIAAGALS
jgi:copper oxidase (laccase) domain-containing protein